METVQEERAVVMRDDRHEVGVSFDLSQANPVKALQQAEAVVRYMAEKCKGDQYIKNIKGKPYPKVEWWTTVGGSLGVFAQEESSKRLDRTEEIAYESVVVLMRGGYTIGRASAICSSRESTWSNRDEYAIKSMATTRATGKAYRIPFSFLAVMAGLQPTPAEEMPHEDDTGAADDKPACPQCHQSADVMESRYPDNGKWYCRVCKAAFNDELPTPAAEKSKKAEPKQKEIF